MQKHISVCPSQSVFILKKSVDIFTSLIMIQVPSIVKSILYTHVFIFKHIVLSLCFWNIKQIEMISSGVLDISTMLTTLRPIFEDTIISNGEKNVKLKWLFTQATPISNLIRTSWFSFLGMRFDRIVIQNQDGNEMKHRWVFLNNFTQLGYMNTWIYISTYIFFISEHLFYGLLKSVFLHVTRIVFSFLLKILIKKTSGRVRLGSVISSILVISFEFLRH